MVALVHSATKNRIVQVCKKSKIHTAGKDFVQFLGKQAPPKHNSAEIIKLLVNHLHLCYLVINNKEPGICIV